MGFTNYTHTPTINKSIFIVLIKIIFYGFPKETGRYCRLENKRLFRFKVRILNYKN